MTEYEILLFYKYTDIPNPEQFRLEHVKLWEELGFKGRMIVAKEGINVTLEGPKENTQKYVELFQNDPEFADINFKRSAGTGSAFPKLSIKVREEVVSGHLSDWDVNPREVTGKYLSAEELHAWIHGGAKEFYIVDMRNDYEHAVGHFQNSILPKELRNFRDLPKILPRLEHLKNKTIITVCTGGIRCEKASGFLVKHGFTDVYQLQHGIVTYMEQYPNEDFLGKLYVFDNRMVMGFNLDDPNHKIVGKCEICGVPSEHFVNVNENNDRRHIICCEECVGKGRVVLD